MRLLNIPCCRNSVCRAEPELVSFTIRDRQFLLDVNSLAVHQIEGEAKVDALNVSPQFGMPEAGVSALVLEVTRACNLKCTYCYNQVYSTDHSSNMSMDVARRALHMCFDHYTREIPPRISFFGGEPMLNWPVVEAVVKEATTMLSPKCVPRFSMTTNATLTTEERVRFLADNKFRLVVSLDGDKQQHDEYRIGQDGKGSFDDVIYGLGMLRWAGVHPVTVRATHTVHDAHLVQRLRFLNEQVYAGLAHNVSIEPISLSESACIGSRQDMTVQEEDLQRLEEEYIDGAIWFATEIKLGHTPKWSRIVEKLSRLLYTIPVCSACSAGTEYLTVSGTGDIFACHRQRSSRIGNLNDGGVNEGLRAKWQDSRFYLREGCPSCSLRLLCGGGCREESLAVNQDIRIPTKTGCAMQMMFVKAALWIMSEIPIEQLAQVIPDPTKC